MFAEVKRRMPGFLKSGKLPPELRQSWKARGLYRSRYAQLEEKRGVGELAEIDRFRLAAGVMVALRKWTKAQAAKEIRVATRLPKAEIEPQKLAPARASRWLSPLVGRAATTRTRERVRAEPVGRLVGARPGRRPGGCGHPQGKRPGSGDVRRRRLSPPSPCTTLTGARRPAYTSLVAPWLPGVLASIAGSGARAGQPVHFLIRGIPFWASNVVGPVTA
jgi:hypothetical protein